MPKPRAPRRHHTAVRLAPEALERVELMAEDETEGNVSAMLRKLLKEALAARDTRAKR